MSGSRTEHELGTLLTDLLDHRGRTPKKLGGDFAETGVPVISAKNIKGGRVNSTEDVRFITEPMFEQWMPTKLDAGDVLVTSEAPLGEIAFFKERPRLCLGQRLFALRPDPKKVVPRFLYYSLLSPEMQHRLHARATGTTAQGIRQSQLRKVLVPLPELDEQLGIAAVLGALDDRIDYATDMLDELEHLSELLFSRLVDRGIASGAAMTEVSAMVETGPKRILRRVTEATYLDMAALSTRWSRPDSWVRRPIGSGARFTNGDALMARITPCLENGKTAFMDFLAEGEVAYGSTEFIVLHSRADVPPEFAYCLTRFGPFRNHAVANMNGTSGRQRVSGEALGRFELPKLDQNDLETFGASVRPIFALVRSLSEQTVALSNLRDRLLPSLLSGRLSWREATPLAITDIAS